MKATSLLCTAIIIALCPGCSQIGTQAFTSQQLNAEENALLLLTTATSDAITSGKLTPAIAQSVVNYESLIATAVNASKTAYESGNYNTATNDLVLAQSTISNLQPLLINDASASNALAAVSSAIQVLSGQVASATSQSTTTTTAP